MDWRELALRATEYMRHKADCGGEAACSCGLETWANAVTAFDKQTRKAHREPPFHLPRHLHKGDGDADGDGFD